MSRYRVVSLILTSMLWLTYSWEFHRCISWKMGDCERQSWEVKITSDREKNIRSREIKLKRGRLRETVNYFWSWEMKLKSRGSREAKLKSATSQKTAKVGVCKRQSWREEDRKKLWKASDLERWSWRIEDPERRSWRVGACKRLWDWEIASDKSWSKEEDHKRLWNFSTSKRRTWRVRDLKKRSRRVGACRRLGECKIANDESEVKSREPRNTAGE